MKKFVKRAMIAVLAYVTIEVIADRILIRTECC